jgi:hypothetical protein
MGRSERVKEGRSYIMADQNEELNDKNEMKQVKGRWWLVEFNCKETKRGNVRIIGEDSKCVASRSPYAATVGTLDSP